MVRIYMIDDHPAVIEGVAFLLSEQEDRMALVGSSLTITDALSKIPTLETDVIILDLFIGTDSPVSNLQSLRTLCPKTPVLIYSAEDSTYWKYLMLKSGANAFLCKTTDNDNIIATIEKILNGSVLLTEDVKAILYPEPENTLSDTLTPEELEMVYDIAYGKTLKNISLQSGKSISFIEKVLRTLRMKTHANSNPELIRILIKRKLIPA